MKQKPGIGRNRIRYLQIPRKGCSYLLSHLMLDQYDITSTFLQRGLNYSFLFRYITNSSDVSTNLFHKFFSVEQLKKKSNFLLFQNRVFFLVCQLKEKSLKKFVKNICRLRIRDSCPVQKNLPRKAEWQVSRYL